MARGEVRFRLVLDSKEFESGVKAASKEFEGFVRNLGGGAGALGSIAQKMGPVGIAMAAAAGLATTAFVKVGAAIADVVEKASHLADISAATNLNVESLQRLAYAGSLVGVSQDSIAAATSRMLKELGNGNEGFARLGLNITRLKDMKPEETFAAVAEKLAAIKNPAEQASAAAAIFGKSFSTILPLIKSDLAETTAEADRLGVVLSEQTVAAADEAGDAGKRVTAAWQGFKDQVAGTIVAASGMDTLLNDLAQGMGALNNAAADNDALKIYVALLERFTGLGQLKDVVRILSLINEGAPQLKGATKAGVGGVFAGPADIDAEAARITREALKIAQQQVKEHEKLVAARKRVAEQAEREAVAARHTLAIQTSINKLVDDMLDDIAKAWMNAPTHNIPLPMPGAGAGFLFDPKDTTLSESTKKLIADAEKAADRYRKWGDEAARLGSILGGPVGAAVGGLAAIFDTLSEHEKQAAANLEAYGSRAMTGKQKVVALAEGLAAVAAAFEQGVRSASKWKGAVHGALTGASAGAAFGPYGAAAGAIIGGIAGFLGGKKGEQQQLAAAREEFERLQAAALAAGIQFGHTFDPRTLQDFKFYIDEINRALGLQTEAENALHDAMEKYGITIDQLGPKWAQQELDKKAAGLLQDWQLLNAAGVDHLVLAEKMGPAMNEYVNLAVKAGADIPLSMKPILDDLYQQGKLVHENGEAYTEEEYKALKYGETMTQMFQGLLKKIEELVNAILGIPNKDVDINVRTKYPSGPPPSDWTGPWNYDGTPDRDHNPYTPMAQGGIVRSPTPALLGEAGPEMVLPLRQAPTVLGLGDLESLLRSIDYRLGQQPRVLGTVVRDAVMQGRA